MGILMIATILENAGYEVHILDSNAVMKKRNIDEIVQIAIKLKPDVIGITLITPTIKESYKLVSRLKDIGAKLIAGGPHATILPDEVIEHGFDAVVIGEGEVTVEDAIKALLGLMPKDDVLGWVYKDNNGQAIYTKQRPLITNLDELPLPARHLIEPSDYGGPNNPKIHMNIFSSRGCPAKCAYCAGGLFGKKFRFRSAQNILQEIEYIYNTYGTKSFHFVDDSMCINKNRVMKFCDDLKMSNLPINFSLMTRIDTIDEDLLENLASAKCVRIDYGIESGCPETLKRIHKPHTVEMVKKILPLTNKYGIKTYVFFILGFPWENLEDTQMTLDIMKEISPYVESFHQALASILIPFPGTEIYEKYKDEFDFENWWLSDNRNYNAPDIKNCSFFESEVFWAGDALKANFFNYSDEMKKKIYEIFRYMYINNLRRYNIFMRYIIKNLIDLSLHIYLISPRMERFIFTPSIYFLQQYRTQNNGFNI
jgi:radical SAM superfamily enzyme YgiQ (UPF0313 family)